MLYRTTVSRSLYEISDISHGGEEAAIQLCYQKSCISWLFSSRIISPCAGRRRGPLDLPISEEIAVLVSASICRTCFLLSGEGTSAR